MFYIQETTEQMQNTAILHVENLLTRILEIQTWTILWTSEI